MIMWLFLKKESDSNNSKADLIENFLYDWREAWGLWVWVKKQVTLIKVTVKGDIVFLCSTNCSLKPDEAESDISSELFSLQPFVTLCSLYSQSFFISFWALVDTGCTAYSLIYSRLTSMVCDQLSLEPVSLFKLKSVHGFDGQLSKLKITHAMYSGLLMKKKHWKITVPMLIADLRQHDIILRKSWMNWNQLLLNMKEDSIVFREDLLLLTKKTVVRCLSSSQQSTSLPLPPHLTTLKILPWPISTTDDKLFQICSVRAAPYAVLAHQEKVQIFTISMKNIDK